MRHPTSQTAHLVDDRCSGVLVGRRRGCWRKLVFDRHTFSLSLSQTCSGQCEQVDTAGVARPTKLRFGALGEFRLRQAARDTEGAQVWTKDLALSSTCNRHRLQPLTNGKRLTIL